MTSKFEQLIEYVINDEEAKAKELFHDIVVEKSREIYENLMTEEEEELEEAEELDEESTHDEDEKAEKAGEKVTKDIEYDDKKDRMDEAEDEEMEEGMDTMGGRASQDLIDDVEAEEEGMEMSEEESDEEGGEDLEDRVIDLEDKLDELMAEFEAMMGDDDDSVDSDLGGDEGEPVDGDSLEMDDTMSFSADSEEEEDMMEGVQLDKVPAPKGGDDGQNAKSPVAANSGARGAVAKPVTTTGATAEGRSAPKNGDLPEAGKFKNVPGKGTSNSKLDSAPKPVTAQASGVNTKTPFPKG